MNKEKLDYNAAEMFCASYGARLVSINNWMENNYVLNMCILDECWLGLKEKPFTGTEDTPQNKQQWIWDDGSTPGSNGYNSWGKADEQALGNYDEPNNGRLGPLARRIDERHGMFRDGSWYDKMLTEKAYAVCEMPSPKVRTETSTTSTTSTSTTSTTSTTTTTSTTSTTTSTTTSPTTTNVITMTNSLFTTPQAVIPMGQQPGLCYPGWAAWGGDCYTVNPNPMSYHAADAWCALHGGGMVSINSRTENYFVQNLCGAKSTCWLGLAEKFHTGTKLTSPEKQQWAWADGSTPGSNKYNQWYQYGSQGGEPDNAKKSDDERYARIKDGSWFDEKPTVLAGAVCEMPGQKVLTFTTAVTTTSTTTTTIITTSTSTSVTTTTFVFTTTSTTTAACPHYCHSTALAARSWKLVCESNTCHQCFQCLGQPEPGPCPLGWHLYNKKCYKVNLDSTSNYTDAKKWCRAQNSDLVSINTKQENEFVWKICGVGTADPINDPNHVRWTPCWIGLTEKNGTGNVTTPQDEQKWVWADGTSLNFDGWKKYCFFCSKEDEKGNEPNNGRVPFHRPYHNDEVVDERYAVMNRLHDDRDGRWYDQPASYKNARAVCEYDPERPLTTSTARVTLTLTTTSTASEVDSKARSGGAFLQNNNGGSSIFNTLQQLFQPQHTTIDDASSFLQTGFLQKRVSRQPGMQSALHL
jgi:hypothetical protein